MSWRKGERAKEWAVHAATDGVLAEDDGSIWRAALGTLDHRRVSSKVSSRVAELQSI